MHGQAWAYFQLLSALAYLTVSYYDLALETMPLGTLNITLAELL